MSSPLDAEATPLSPPIVPAGQCLEEIERITIENHFLRLQNLGLQLRDLDRTKQDLIAEMRREEAGLEQYRAALSAKYGTEISPQTVTAAGVIKRTA